MGMIANALRELLAAGMAGDALVAAIARIEDQPKERSSGAIRQQRYRDRQAGRVTSHNVTASHNVTRDSALSSSLNSEQEQKKEAKKERSRGEKIPPHWQPTECHFGEGEKLGMSRQDVTGLAEDMRIWARTNEHRAVARKSDWDLTFTGWMRRNRQPRAPPNGHINGTPRPGSREDTRERTANAVRKLAEYTDANADEQRRGRGSGPSPDGFLPLEKPR